MKILDEETGSKNKFRFCAVDDSGKTLGCIEAYKTKIGTHVVYAVLDVSVDASSRRRGIATKLYESAAQEACRRRARLGSVQRIADAFSNDFWEKQVARGRAQQFAPDRKTIQSVPADIMKKHKRSFHRFVLKDCSARIDLSRFRR